MKREIKNKDLALKSDNKMSIDASVVLTEFLRSLSNQWYSSELMSLTLMSMRSKMIADGYKEEEVNKIISMIANALSKTRSEGVQDFMG